MSRRVGWLLCSSLALACKPESSAPEPSAAPSVVAETPVAPGGPPVGSLVVIAADATLYTAPDRTAAPVPSYVADEGAQGRLVQVLARAGEFLEVWPARLARPYACASTFAAAELYDLSFFVPRDAIEPVLIEPKTVELARGTKLELAVGVPVIGDDEIIVGSERLIVDLADAKIGGWYPAPTTARTDLPTLPSWRNWQLSYGERSISSDSELFAYAHERTEVAGGELLTFINACGRFTLLSQNPSGELDPEHMRDPSGSLEQQPQPDRDACKRLRWMATAGTEVSWQDGGNAGMVRRGHELPADAREQADQVCFDVDLLQLCIAKPELERFEPSECRQRSNPDPTLPIVYASFDRAPFMTFLPITINSEADRAMTQRIILAHINQLRDCYNQARKREPSVHGRMTIAFEVDAGGGQTAHAELSASSLEPIDSELQACVVGAFERLEFHEPISGQALRVKAPLIFGVD